MSSWHNGMVPFLTFYLFQIWVLNFYCSMNWFCQFGIVCSAYNPFSLVLYLLVRCNNVQDWLVDRAYFFPFSLCSGIRTLNLKILSQLLNHCAMRAQPDFSTYTIHFPHSFFFRRNGRIWILNHRIMCQMFHYYATQAQLAFTACFGMYAILFLHALLMVEFETSILVLLAKMFYHHATEAQLSFTVYFREYTILLSPCTLSWKKW
jgi:hypothetical protein